MIKKRYSHIPCPTQDIKQEWDTNTKDSIKYNKTFCNDPKFSDRQVWANCVDLDQTAPGSTLFAFHPHL